MRVTPWTCLSQSKIETRGSSSERRCARPVVHQVALTGHTSGGGDIGARRDVQYSTQQLNRS
eukprot:7120776-Prymnesium_polylepis.1